MWKKTFLGLHKELQTKVIRTLFFFFFMVDNILCSACSADIPRQVVRPDVEEPSKKGATDNNGS
jgi:hypothetical protein